MPSEQRPRLSLTRCDRELDVWSVCAAEPFSPPLEPVLFGLVKPVGIEPVDDVVMTGNACESLIGGSRLFLVAEKGA